MVFLLTYSTGFEMHATSGAAFLATRKKYQQHLRLSLTNVLVEAVDLLVPWHLPSA